MYKWKKMYFFNIDKTSSFDIIILLLRMVGCLILGERISEMAIEDREIRLYFLKGNV